MIEARHAFTAIAACLILTGATAAIASGLEDIVRKSSGGIFNNAAQIWNHTFYWKSMRTKGGGEPPAAALVQRREVREEVQADGGRAVVGDAPARGSGHAVLIRRSGPPEGDPLRDAAAPWRGGAQWSRTRA